MQTWSSERLLRKLNTVDYSGGLFGREPYEIPLPIPSLVESVESAVCTFPKRPNNDVEGTIRLTSIGDGRTQAICALTGLTPGQHGLHVHEGHTKNGCDSTCKHYDPTESTHGGASGHPRHKGDFGNIDANFNGVSTNTILADVSLKDILNRTFVIHANPDDLGTGTGKNQKSSQETGNSGKRVACGMIRKIEN